MCHCCNGSGWIYVTQDSVTRVAACECRRERVIHERLSKVPERYTGAVLKANDSIHEAQSRVVSELQANPHQSAAFTGINGSGKTHLFYALYYKAAEDPTRRVYLYKLKHWLSDVGKQIRGESDSRGRAFNCDLTAAALSHGRRVSVFLEEIDKAKPTEFAAAELFDIVDTIYEQRLQLVVTSNVGIEELGEFWAATDSLGPSIARRIMDICTEYNFYHTDKEAA